jgi:hypothetical protein
MGILPFLSGGLPAIANLPNRCFPFFSLRWRFSGNANQPGRSTGWVFGLLCDQVTIIRMRTVSFLEEGAAAALAGGLLVRRLAGFLKWRLASARMVLRAPLVNLYI